jgi:hypothetical protein
MPRRLAAAVALSLATGCFPTQDIDPAEVPVSIEGYEGWHEIGPLLGPAPGHGDSYRVLYVNDVAREYTGAGSYPLGAAMVKEIYAVDGDGGRGAFRYSAVMRRIDEDAEPDLPILGGWLFTDVSEDGSEVANDLCWDSCHRQAPYDGSWFDHGL